MRSFFWQFWAHLQFHFLNFLLLFGKCLYLIFSWEAQTFFQKSFVAFRPFTHVKEVHGKATAIFNRIKTFFSVRSKLRNCWNLKFIKSPYATNLAMCKRALRRKNFLEFAVNGEVIKAWVICYLTWKTSLLQLYIF